MLAILLVHSGRPVTRAHLAEALWDEDPLRDPHGALRSYVYSLRKRLDFDHRLRTEADGYSLLLRDGDELDLQRFHGLVQRAREVQGTGDVATAADLLEQALAVWRDPALADLPSTPAMQPAVVELLEHRRAAEDLLIDAQLALGRHRDLLPSLIARTTAEPLRERRWEQLMLGLYRSGRQAEALDAYARARTVLAEECGIEPGFGLRQLQERMLNGDPSFYLGPVIAPAEPPELAAAGETGPAHGEPTPSASLITVPHQLPATGRHLVGRHAELAMLADVACQASPHGSSAVVAAICGAPGVGKSALALRFAHSAAAEFPDGELYVDLAGYDAHRRPVAPKEALRVFLDSLGVSRDRMPATLDARAALYRSLLADRRMLIVADNALDSAQVRVLTVASPGSMLLVTSRNQMSGLVASHDATRVTVDTLPEGAARELLAKRLGEERVLAEPEAVTDVIGFCAGLPLALTLLAARATTHPAASLSGIAEQLGTHHNPADILDSIEPSAGLRAAFHSSYAKLSEGAAQMFRVLGVQADVDITEADAAALAEVPLYAARRALAELTRSHLLVECCVGRFRLSDLLRAYAAERAAADMAFPPAASTRPRLSAIRRHRFDPPNNRHDRHDTGRSPAAVTQHGSSTDTQPLSASPSTRNRPR